jgi:hypothetical protein
VVSSTALIVLARTTTTRLRQWLLDTDEFEPYMPRKGEQVPDATKVTKRRPRKPAAKGADPEPHRNRATTPPAPRKPVLPPDPTFRLPGSPRTKTPAALAKQRAESDQRAREDQQRLARPTTQPSKAPAQPKARAAFGHVTYDGVRVQVTVLCPWCEEQHTHRPGDGTHQTCPADGRRYSVLIPLQALEVLQ